jgi:aspartyl/asparaginyl beta-hydroxylase (cupin superfamily)
MNAGMIETRHWILAIFIVSALYVHFRGTVRFGLVRALTDFTVLLAPVNAIMYLFSRTRRTAYIDPSEFPELAPLQANWQIIRDEAMALADGGQILIKSDGSKVITNGKGQVSVFDKDCNPIGETFPGGSE